MLTSKRQFGDTGEDLAAAHLRAKGYRILARQVRVGSMGELDLVAEKGGRLVFVEVKTRRDASYGPPEEALTPSKRERFRKAIHGWLARHGLEQVRFRADVIAVDFTAEEPQFRHHEGVEL